MIKVLHQKSVGHFQLELSFSDGSHSVFDATDYLAHRSGPMLEPLRDASYFNRCFIEAGALCWPNGLELSPSRVKELCHLAVTH